MFLLNRLNKKRPSAKKLNPLRNQTALKRLNPHAILVKRFARKLNAQRSAARAVLRKTKSGKKATPDELKMVQKVLGRKAQTIKTYRALLEKKKAKAEKAKAAAKKPAAKKVVKK